ncbi:MAG: recombinase [Ruminococcaceae bacterium]|nr:recombinase [Oscillospiraceae bacterium]
MKLEHVLKEFIFDCEVKNFSQKTIKGYRNNSLYLFKFLEEKYEVLDIEHVTPKQIKEFFRILWSNGRRTTYTNGLLKVYRAFFKYAYNEGYIQANPCLKVPWGKEEKTVIKTFENDDVRNMLEVYNGRDYISVRNKAILAMLIDTGIRNNELCTLDNSNVFERYIRFLGKGYKEREVGKSPYLAKVLMRYEQTKEGYFKYKNIRYTNYFLSKNGKPLTVEAVERVVANAGKLAKVDTTVRCSPHTLRHFFAQSQLRNNLDVYSLSRLMGHENIKITQRYLQGMQDKDIVARGISSSPLMNL